MMEQWSEHYLQKRPYRKKCLGSAEGKFLLKFMGKKFFAPSDTYWERFGYEVGGPVCYGYVKWIINEIEQKHPDITDLAFVARDGWLLQKVFNALPHRPDLKDHYIYAPRTMNLLCQDEEIHTAYRQYLSEQAWGGGTVAVVDTVTMKFSSQRVIASSLKQATHGFFWVVLEGQKNYGTSFHFSTYQVARYHTIRCWNLMEFIMTSPEPPIYAMEGCVPLYRVPNHFEEQRRTIFMQIETGVLELISDICDAGSFPALSNDFITKWVNDFLNNPDQEERIAFEKVMCSEREDHSDCISLNPFGQRVMSVKKLKDGLWLFSQRHKYLYRVLHAGNVGRKKIKMHFQGRGALKFDGKNVSTLADMLSKYDIVSFDIFDTLIFRKIGKPTDLFYKIEEKNGLFDFHDNRIQAEADARHNSGKLNGEIDLFDIYQELSRHYLLDAEEKAMEEFAAEKADCYANPVMKELYQLLVEKGCRMIAVSDMYIPGKYLRELLDHCGYSKIEQVFASCDYGMRKGNGALQKLVQSELGNKLRIIHIGDNFASDVHGSETAGWSAVWYQRKNYKR